jgi:hypothetical protein
VRLGQIVSGTVIARATFGVWLDIGVGHPALLLVPEMHGAKDHNIAFEDYPEAGASIEVCIIALGNRGEINLSQYPPTLQTKNEWLIFHHITKRLCVPANCVTLLGLPLLSEDQILQRLQKSCE